MLTARRYIPQVFIVLTLCVLGLGILGCRTETTGPVQFQPVEIAGRTFNLELALTPEARMQGLSDREHIDPAGGMLFVFPDDDEREFVMRRCPVPIDVVFVSGGGRVLAQHAMQVEPAGTLEWNLQRYPSEGPAAFAIELAGGTLAELNLKRGETLEFPLRELKRKAR